MRTWLLSILFLIPFTVIAQQSVTVVKGTVTDAENGRPLEGINIIVEGSSHGTSTDKEGTFILSSGTPFSRVIFSFIGYQSVTKSIKPGQINEVKVRLQSSRAQLKEVSITSGTGKRYRNKGNPAVEFIQQVIDHKPQNRMESADYIQFDQYDRIGLSLFNVPARLINNRLFSRYKFLMDTTMVINGKKQSSFPGYFNEKLSKHYYRKNPEKTIEVLEAEKGINVIKFIDTAGIDVYLKRLYGDHIDIYDNNILIFTNQFLSPIADHAPEFYKFFIVDTLQTPLGKLAVLRFTPRNRGDLLFEGKLLVTLDGTYAVTACELDLNNQINLNFINNMQIRLDFQPYVGGRYELVKSDIKADFGLLKNRGMGVFGQRTVNYSNYRLNAPLPDDFYRGKSTQAVANTNPTDTSYWAHHRTDTLSPEQKTAYQHIGRLESMHSFKVMTWFANTFAHDFANIGPVQAGPVSSTVTYNTQEGARFQLGGRTTPQFNPSFYLSGYIGYGAGDRQLKYDLSTYYSFNKTAPYRFPHDYFKLSYLYDVDIPGQSFALNNSRAVLSSFQSGTTDYWLYDRIFSVAYVKEFENHFSYNVSFRNWKQAPAGTLQFRSNDQPNALVPNLTTNQLTLAFRYAPHEQFIQGALDRTPIVGKHPIFNLQVTQGLSSYPYTDFSGSVSKHFYLSQLGYSDVTLSGSLLTGKIPFPLLSIIPANQSPAYDQEAYNKMYYLEFVSDHYASINFTQSFNGFFLNKIPLVKHLKWREFLSLKALYGGLRKQNDPLYSTGLYQFPSPANGANGTYALGNTPYLETGLGVGNIFKFLRIDLIRRLNYLDHPGITPYSFKVSFNLDF